MNYFIPYNETSQVNYLYVLYLYGIATYNRDTRLYDTVRFDTLTTLTDAINEKFLCYTQPNNPISKTTIIMLL